MERPDNTEYCGSMKIINSTELADKRLGRIDWLTEGLLKPGLSILAGAPKIGKSWMVLQLCLAVSKGEPFLGMATRKSSVLYITLEDSETRIQERINRITEETSENLYVTLSCSPLGEELSRELAEFCIRHSDTRLIVIDTFQKIREQAAQMSYSGDYADISYLKHIADQLNITILLVHHTRKLSDSDVINEISGTNGIAGSADTLMILKKRKRSDPIAYLSCTGRDIEDAGFELKLDRETCTWRIISSSLKRDDCDLPAIITQLIGYAVKIGEYTGSNTEFCQAFCAFSGESITPSQLKRIMNRYRYEMEDAGVFFISVRKASGRILAVYCKKAEEHIPERMQDHTEEPCSRDCDHNRAGEALTDADRSYYYDDLIADSEEIPLPGDDDAPPERDDDTWLYRP